MWGRTLLQLHVTFRGKRVEIFVIYVVLVYIQKGLALPSVIMTILPSDASNQPAQPEKTICLVIASDGVFEFLTNPSVTDMVARYLTHTC